MLLKLFLLLQITSHIKTELRWQEQQKSVLVHVNELISVIIEEHIPENESITFYYDQAWKESGLKPGDILKQKSSKYRQWMTKTYQKGDTVQNEIFGNVISGDKIPKVMHDNIIIYYNKSQYYIDVENQRIRSIFTKNKMLIYLSEFDLGEMLKDCRGLISNIISKSTQCVLIMLDAAGDTLRVRRIEINDLQLCDKIISTTLVGNWNISSGELNKFDIFFPRLKSYSCRYPVFSYVSQGNTECIINHPKARDGFRNFSLPSGACIDMSQLILQKALSVNNILYERISATTVQMNYIANAEIDVFLDAASTEYIYIPNFVISNIIGFENVSVVLINPSDAYEQRAFVKINTSTVLGLGVLGLVFLAACIIFKSYLHNNGLDSSLFITLTWVIFLGFAVPSQPRGKFRIIFIAFVILSFFLITLFSQNLYKELTIRSECEGLTTEELERRGIHELKHSIFHDLFNTKSLHASLFTNATWNESMRYIVTNLNLMSTVRSVKYIVLKEYFIRPKFFYLAYSMPMEKINKLILRSTQAGLDHKWRWKYQRKLSRASEEYKNNESLVADVDNNNDIFDDDEYDDEADEDAYKPVYISDVIVPLLLIYSLLALSAVVFIIEILIYKIRVQRAEQSMISVKF